MLSYPYISCDPRLKITVFVSVWGEAICVGIANLNLHLFCNSAIFYRNGLNVIKTLTTGLMLNDFFQECPLGIQRYENRYNGCCRLVDTESLRVGGQLKIHCWCVSINNTTVLVHWIPFHRTCCLSDTCLLSSHLQKCFAEDILYKCKRSASRWTTRDNLSIWTLWVSG